jgi:hypothetical protein
MTDDNAWVVETHSVSPTGEKPVPDPDTFQNSGGVKFGVFDR